jgi:hypothetical protein
MVGGLSNIPETQFTCVSILQPPCCVIGAAGDSPIPAAHSHSPQCMKYMASCWLSTATMQITQQLLIDGMSGSCCYGHIPAGMPCTAGY